MGFNDLPGSSSMDAAPRNVMDEQGVLDPLSGVLPEGTTGTLAWQRPRHSGCGLL